MFRLGWLAAAVASVALVALSCASDPDDGEQGVPFADDVRFEVQDRDNQRTEVDTVAELEELLAFKIAWPQYLPENLELKWATVLLPPSIIDGATRVRRVSIMLRFGDDDGTVGLMLDERLGNVSLGGTDVEQVAIGNVTGELVRGGNEVAAAQQMVTLSWSACEVSIVMATSTLQLAESEIIRIAQSTLDACE